MSSPKTSTAKRKKLSKIFDADYYENGISSQKSNYKDYSWPRLGGEFTKTAAHIKSHFNPSTLLDVGCAKGFLVYALRKLNIDASGIDFSEYAISNASEEIKNHVTVGLAESMSPQYSENSFDVVTCFDVLEHLTEKDAIKACKNALDIATKYVIVCVPTRKVEGDLDVTHKTIKPKEWWEQIFMEHGGHIEPVERHSDKNVWWFNIADFLIVVRK